MFEEETSIASNRFSERSNWLFKNDIARESKLEANGNRDASFIFFSFPILPPSSLSLGASPLSTSKTNPHPITSLNPPSPLSIYLTLLTNLPTNSFSPPFISQSPFVIPPNQASCDLPLSFFFPFSSTSSQLNSSSESNAVPSSPKVQVHWFRMIPSKLKPIRRAALMELVLEEVAVH